MSKNEQGATLATTFHSQLSLDEQLVERAGQGDADGIEQLLAIGANPKAFGARALLLAAETGAPTVSAS